VITTLAGWASCAVLAPWSCRVSLRRTSSAPRTGPIPAPTARSVRVPAARCRRRARCLRGIHGRRGTTRVVCQRELHQSREAFDRARQPRGVRAAADAAAPEDQRRPGPRAAQTESPAGKALSLPVDPTGGQPVSQQRPGRDHARALHRARVPSRADARSQVRALPDHQRSRRGRRGLLRVPVPLPQRPEPDRRARARARVHQAAAAAAERPARDPRPGAVRALQPPDGGIGRVPRRRDDRRGTRGVGRRRADRSGEGRRHPGRPGGRFVLRNVKVRHAGEHDVYVLESDGYLLDRFKTSTRASNGVLTFVEDHGLMENCEAAGHGDSGLYPGAGAATGNQRDTTSNRPSATARRSATATPTTTPAATRAPTATPSTSTTNNFYDNALGFTTTSSRPPATPPSRELGPDREQTTSTRTTSTLRARLRRRPKRFPSRSAPACGSRAETTTSSATTASTTTGGAAPCSSPCPIRPSAAGGRRPVAAGRLQPDGGSRLESYRNQFYGNLMEGRPMEPSSPTAPGTRRPGVRTSGGTSSWATLATAGTATPAGRHRVERDQHATGPVPAVGLRRLERRHRRPAAGTRAAQLPRRHHLQDEHVSVVHHTIQAVGGRPHRGCPTSQR